MYRFKFEKLEIWELSILLTVDIYDLCKKLPSDEKYSLISQLKRASNSISANIAEGVARQGNREKARFISIAYGSLMEVVSHLTVCLKLNFISIEDYNILRPKISELSNKINSFHNSLLNSPPKQLGDN